MANKQKQLDALILNALKSDVGRFETFFATYWKQIVIVAVALVVVITVGYGYSAISSNAARKAAFALADASTTDELNSVLKKYADNPGAASARLRLVKLLAADKKYDEALQELNIIINAKPEESLLGKAMLTSAYLQELKGSYEKAAAEFEAIGLRTELSAKVRAEANTNAGRLYLQLKNLDKAAAALKQASTPVQGSASATAWSMEAKSLLIALENNEYGKFKAESAPNK